jgi:hypothetical protein
MHRNLRIYRDEARRSHVQEGIVASIWTFLFVGMLAGSLFAGQPKSIETAGISNAAAASLPKGLEHR